MKSKLSFCLLVIVLCAAMTGCGSKLPKSDKEVEEKLDGTWKATYYETEYEDGEELRMKMTETITYDATTNTFETTIKAKLVSPMSINFFTLDADGKWSADEKSLTEKYDVDGVELKFHTGLFDASDRKEMKKELLSEIDEKAVSEIREITENSFTVYDGEDEIVYYKQ